MTSPALLVMDIQNGVVDRFAEQVGPLLTTLAETASAARESGVPVVYVRVAFRVGAPEISPMNQTFRNLGRAGMGEADTATQIHSVVAPQAGDIVVTKRRVSAFVGSDLDVVLRSLDVDSLVLTGIATSGVVLSTLRQAADQSNWGPSVAPGAYQYEADTQIMQPCFIQHPGAYIAVVSGLGDPDTEQGVNPIAATPPSSTTPTSPSTDVPPVVQA